MDCNKFKAISGSRSRVAARSRTSGFTLLELLIASGIAALLMVSVLQLVAHLALDQNRMERHESSSGVSPVLQLFRTDLNRSVKLEVSAPGEPIVMQGYGAIDSGTLKPTGRAARVTYRVVNTRSGPWLVREERSLDDPKVPALIQLVMAGVSSISLVPEAAESLSAPHQDSGSISRHPATAPSGVEHGAQHDVLPQRNSGRILLRLQWCDAAGKTSDEQWIVQ